MPLVSIRELLRAADGYAVGSFSVGNMEMILGAVAAAEQRHSPAILQIAQVRLPYAPLRIIGPMMVAAAKAARVPVAVHFDHGTSLDAIGTALELGFTSVMFDGSHLPYAENVAGVRAAKALADRYGAAVEAEIGRVGGSEDGKASEAVCSDPAEAQRFYEETGVDALAVAIGNAHGKYQGVPQLHFEVLRDIHARVPAPLVLHGGSGIGEDGFRACIAGGIKKINIATASFTALEAAARAHAEQGQHDYFALSRRMANAVQECVEEHMRIFMSENRA